MKKILVVLLVSGVLFSVLTSCATQVANEKMRSAVQWRQQGDMERYQYLVREAYAADPNNAYALNDMGTIAEGEGKYGEAAGFYKKAIENAGDKRISVSDVKADQGRLLKDVAAENLKNLQMKMNK